MTNEFDMSEFLSGEEVELEIDIVPMQDALSEFPVRCDGWDRVPHDAKGITGIAIHIYDDINQQETLLYCPDCYDRKEEDEE